MYFAPINPFRERITNEAEIINIAKLGVLSNSFHLRLLRKICAMLSSGFVLFLQYLVKSLRTGAVQ